MVSTESVRSLAQDPEALVSIVERFRNTSVLVVGDVMLDEFIFGKVHRISPEAPVPVVRVERETMMLGGAANVVNNLVALGARVGCCGLVGRDRMGAEVLAMLKDSGCNADAVLADPTRPTIVKTRVIAHSQQVVRFDREERSAPDPRVVAELAEAVERAFGNYEVVIFSDYNKGVVTKDLVDRVLPRMLAAGATVLVDPKPQNIGLFRGVAMITPNHLEAGVAAGVEIESEEALVRAGAALLQELACRSVLITRGEHGMTLFEQGGTVTHIPTAATEVYDVTGAGDTVVGVLGLCLAAGAGFREAAHVANLAAGRVIRKVGTATVDAEELCDAIREAFG